MKNILNVVAILTICIGIVLLQSCSKCQLVNSNIIQNDLKKLSDDFISKNKNISGTNKPPKWLQVLGSDLKGALSGAATGLGIGTAIPGLGSTAGTIIGAVAGGASASIEKASELLINSANNIYPQPVAFDPIGNDQNNMNNVGLQHYNCINNAFISKSNYLTNNFYDNSLFYNLSGNYLINIGLFPNNWTSTFSINNSNTNLNYLKTNDSLTTSEFLLLIYNDNKINGNIKCLLKPYFDCLNVANSVDDFITYSISAENYVSNLNIPQSDKQFVLIIMSTARNGIQFWSLY
jgi:outer membrane lipoprotein SlyB